MTESRALRLAVQTAGVPSHLHEGLILYLEVGILPGGFLQAVLCNDLAGAVQRGDPSSLLGLVRLVQFLMECAPATAWGSRRAVIAWTVTPERLEV